MMMFLLVWSKDPMGSYGQLGSSAQDIQIDRQVVSLIEYYVSKIELRINYIVRNIPCNRKNHMNYNFSIVFSSYTTNILEDFT